jgi:predicted nucleic acid-binding Zn ribbon protein
MESAWPTCQLCGIAIISRRSDSKFCENGCKQKVYRDRKRKAVQQVKITMHSKLESQLTAYTVWSAADAQKALDKLSGPLDAAAVEGIKKHLAKVVLRGKTSEASRIFDFDEEERVRDYNAYYARTGLF